jgi:hypothetical protein
MQIDDDTDIAINSIDVTQHVRPSLPLTTTIL